MDVSVCLVTRGQRDELFNCLTSLKQATSQIEYEVIVVDMGSVDGTLEMLAAEFPDAKLIRLRTDQGFTVPMNMALKSATGDYLLLLNPASVIHQDLLENLLAFIDVYPEAGICTPKVLDQRGNLRRDCRRSAGAPADVLAEVSGLATLFPKHDVLGRRCLRFLPLNEICEVEAVSRDCMLLRRELLDEVGYLDEAFSGAESDSDYCFRARDAGWEVYYVPAASMVCTQDRPFDPEPFLRYYNKNLAALYEPWLNKAVEIAVKAGGRIHGVTKSLQKYK